MIPTTRATKVTKVTTLLDLLEIQLCTDEGWPQLTCHLNLEALDAAAAVLAEGIARRRIPGNPRLHTLWQTRRLSPSGVAIDDSDRQLFEAGLLENFGTPEQPSQACHLHGLVAESIWHEVVTEIDAGLGRPLLVEGHDWSATDPGGDGLTVYETVDGGFCFRLWESKHHGADAPVRVTVNTACRQVKSRALSYLSRFSLIAQQKADNDTLARFCGLLAERWVNCDPAAGVGISVGTDDDAAIDSCFGNVTTYFGLTPSQHQAQLHLVGDFEELARQVRIQVWRGCGLWTEP